MKTIEQGRFDGKKVLVRCDFNVPIDATGRITDETRIRESLPTLKALLEQGAALILMSHLGRPAGTGFEADYSLAPVAARLKEVLGRPVQFNQDVFTEKTVQAA
ncbi:MAG: phosphoglycerate kinase, partial [Bacteroidales bacterium]|nr:phosphoglycerate kinase [Bacteroidales bacterium]